MPVWQIIDNFTGSINSVTLVATIDERCTQTSKIKVKGAQNVVFGKSLEPTGEKTVIKIDAINIKSQDLTDTLIESGYAR